MRCPTSFGCHGLLQDRKCHASQYHIINMRHSFRGEEPVWYCRRCNIGQTICRLIIKICLQRSILETLVSPTILGSVDDAVPKVFLKALKVPSFMDLQESMFDSNPCWSGSLTEFKYPRTSIKNVSIVIAGHNSVFSPKPLMVSKPAPPSITFDDAEPVKKSCRVHPNTFWIFMDTSVDVVEVTPVAWYVPKLMKVCFFVQLLLKAFVLDPLLLVLFRKT